MSSSQQQQDSPAVPVSDADLQAWANSTCQNGDRLWNEEVGRAVQDHALDRLAALLALDLPWDTVWDKAWEPSTEDFEKERALVVATRRRRAVTGAAAKKRKLPIDFSASPDVAEHREQNVLVCAVVRRDKAGLLAAIAAFPPTCSKLFADRPCLLQDASERALLVAELLGYEELCGPLRRAVARAKYGEALRARGQVAWEEALKETTAWHMDVRSATLLLEMPTPWEKQCGFALADMLVKDEHAKYDYGQKEKAAAMIELLRSAVQDGAAAAVNNAKPRSEKIAPVDDGYFSVAAPKKKRDERPPYTLYVLRWQSVAGQSATGVRRAERIEIPAGAKTVADVQKHLAAESTAGWFGFKLQVSWRPQIYLDGHAQASTALLADIASTLHARGGIADVDEIVPVKEDHYEFDIEFHDEGC